MSTNSESSPSVMVICGFFNDFVISSKSLSTAPELLVRSRLPKSLSSPPPGRGTDLTAPFDPAMMAERDAAVLLLTSASLLRLVKRAIAVIRTLSVMTESMMTTASVAVLLLEAEEEEDSSDDGVTSRRLVMPSEPRSVAARRAARLAAAFSPTNSINAVPELYELRCCVLRGVRERMTKSLRLRRRIGLKAREQLPKLPKLSRNEKEKVKENTKPPVHVEQAGVVGEVGVVDAEGEVGEVGEVGVDVGEEGDEGVVGHALRGAAESSVDPTHTSRLLPLHPVFFDRLISALFCGSRMLIRLH